MFQCCHDVGFFRNMDAVGRGLFARGVRHCGQGVVSGVAKANVAARVRDMP